MNYILKNLNIFGSDNCAVYIENGIISSKFNYDSSRCEEIDCSGLTAFPGFVDVHVHLREPGFSYKETIKTGSMAGAAGGYTAIGAVSYTHLCTWEYTLFWTLRPPLYWE